MKIDIRKGEALNRAYLLTDKNQLNEIGLPENEKNYVQNKLDKGTNLILFNHFSEWFYIVYADSSKGESSFLEECRRKGNEINLHLRKEKISSITLTALKENSDAVLALAEGLALGSYDFSKYLSKPAENSSELKEILFSNDWVSEEKINELKIIVDSVFRIRDMINEPVSFLNAEKLSETFEELGRES
jgi:leucyl aminopeptidase